MILRPRHYLRIAHARLTQDVPVYAHFGVTHRCGLTCKMCGIWRYGDRADELSLDQIRVVADRMARIGVAQVAIGGGEPFEREDLPEIVRIFVERGVNLRVLTNGVTTPWDRLDACVDAGAVNFSISLDSLYPARYDYICEAGESWTRGIRTMLHIAERTLPRYGLPTLNCVVSNLNLEELPDMVRFADAIGFAISFLPIELLADPKDGVRNWEARFIRHRPEMGLHGSDDPRRVRARIDAAYDAIIAMKAAGWPVLNSTPYLEASRRYLTTGAFPQTSEQKCDAGRLYFSVAPNGQFTVCHRKAYDHLSFLDPGFDAYWDSQVYRSAAKEEADSCEGCMRACWIDTTFMFHTMQGFVETAVLTLRRRQAKLPTYEEALGWAKWDGVEQTNQRVQEAAPAAK
jgi:MoaA/NifB/PqqE/SkfB family radical SAM enzyme